MAILYTSVNKPITLLFSSLEVYCRRPASVMHQAKHWYCGLHILLSCKGDQMSDPKFDFKEFHAQHPQLPSEEEVPAMSKCLIVGIQSLALKTICQAVITKLLYHSAMTKGQNDSFRRWRSIGRGDILQYCQDDILAKHIMGEVAQELNNLIESGWLVPIRYEDQRDSKVEWMISKSFADFLFCNEFQRIYTLTRPSRVY